MKKKGYFLTLDAFIATVIIAAGLLLLLFLTSYRPEQEQAVFFADDLAKGMATQTVRNTNTPEIQQMRRDGDIRNLENSLFEQIGEFYIREEFTLAETFTESITIGRIPPQYGYSVRVDDAIMYETGVERNSSGLLISSKVILSGTPNKSMFWGPFVGEVRVWQQ